jgi:flagellar basal-body rod modification protein FlgD
MTSASALTSNTSAAYQTTTAGGTPTKTPSNQLDANSFIVLLMAQLKSQDPTNPMNPTDMMNQLTTMNSLQELISIRQDLEKVLAPVPATPAASQTNSTQA